MRRVVLASLLFVTVSTISCAPPDPINPELATITSALVPASSSVPVLSPTVLLKPVPTLKLEDYNGGFFSIKKPVGWNLVTAGSCSTFAFCIKDSEHPTNQIFYFNELGPVYLAEEQRTADKNYVGMGGSLPPMVRDACRQSAYPRELSFEV